MLTIHVFVLLEGGHFWRFATMLSWFSLFSKFSLISHYVACQKFVLHSLFLNNFLVREYIVPNHPYHSYHNNRITQEVLPAVLFRKTSQYLFLFRRTLQYLFLAILFYYVLSNNNCYVRCNVRCTINTDDNHQYFESFLFHQVCFFPTT